MTRSLSAWIALPGAVIVSACVLGLPATAGAQERAGRQPATRTADPAPDQGSVRGTAVPRGSDQPVSTPPRTGDRASETPRDSNPPTSGPRDTKPVVGEAVPRSSAPAPRDGGRVFVPTYGGYYPWGPVYGGYYGGYYGAYDPWYGWYPTYGASSYTYGYEGSLRLKVKPKEASVYVEGYYVGVVDDFDGIFQRLHLTAGPHRVEIRAPGYETLAVDVRIEPDETTTYRGQLTRQP